MPVSIGLPTPIGLNVWSRLVERTFPYLDQTAAPFDSLWFPDHVQYGGNKVAEGWTLLAYALARYPDKLCGHEVLCNSFRNPAHLAKMVATAQALSAAASSSVSARGGTRRRTWRMAGRFRRPGRASPSSGRPSS